MTRKSACRISGNRQTTDTAKSQKSGYLYSNGWQSYQDRGDYNRKPK